MPPFALSPTGQGGGVDQLSFPVAVAVLAPDLPVNAPLLAANHGYFLLFPVVN